MTGINAFEHGIILLAICFAAFLIIHFYVRLKVYKRYKVLIDNKVDLRSEHLFSKIKLKRDIIPRYPHLEKEILSFQQHFMFSLKLGTGLVVLIIILGSYLLFWSRKG